MIILTIAIPTYNRSIFLDKCLNSFLSQVKNLDNIEILVSDNCSTDNTSKVVSYYIDLGYNINYYKNSENLGFDRNFASCFIKAKGKYVWVFGDDDMILPGYLELVLNILKKDDYSSLFVNCLWYQEELKIPVSNNSILDFEVFTDPIKYIEKVHYWTTFISGNIVNKSRFKELSTIEEYYDTYLTQLSWLLPLIFSGSNNIYINNQVLACKSGNTGGYRLYEVFGKNFNNILNDMINNKGIDKRIKPLIINPLLISFFPSFIKSRSNNFTKENYMKVLAPVFWKNKYFWINIFPIYVYQKLYINKINSVVKYLLKKC